jgi:NhaP-type Na+/H+ or K+/H+ antiporter
MALDTYLLAMAVGGLAVLGVALLPRLLSRQPLSIPIVYVAAGALCFALPLGLPVPDPVEYGMVTERLTELGVILALMGAGLKIDRVPGLSSWATTWRLLAVTMPLTIAATAVLGWGVLGFAPASAILLGAVVAPTDPVLASAVQVEDPGEGAEEEPLPEEEGNRHEVGFALTSEAGLNDGLAFPFTYLAVLAVTQGLAPRNWLGEWLGFYVGYRIVVGVLAGAVLGWVLTRVVFNVTAEGELARAVHGLEALGATLLVYGATELVEGYGFLAVFVAAVLFRHNERSHEYHETVHALAEKSEQVLMVVVMLLFGGALATGLLDPLQPVDAVVGLALVLVVRPLAGLLGLLGFDRNFSERSVVAFYGIRGIGSFFYLAYALEQAAFPGAERLWAFVGFVVLVSVVLHGVTATRAIARLTREDPSV